MQEARTKAKTGRKTKRGSIKKELLTLEKNKPTGLRGTKKRGDNTYGRLAQAIMHPVKSDVPVSPKRKEATAEEQAAQYRKMEAFVRKNLQRIAKDLVYRSKHAVLPKNSMYSKAVSILENMIGNTSMVESVVHSLCLQFTADNYDNR